MLYRTLNTNGKGLEALSTSKIKDFKVKIKVAKAMKWFKEEVSLLQAGMEAVNDSYELDNQFTKEGDWKGTLDEKRDYLDNSRAKAKKLNQLFKEECTTLSNITFTTDELKDIKELDSDAISDLFILGLISE